MADTSNITVYQAFQTPFVQGVISQLPTPDYAFQRFYGSMTNRTFTPVRVFGWDQFNKTRTVATVKPPMTEATAIKRQKIGTVMGACVRIFEKLHVFDEEIANLRPPGSPIGTLDQRGEQWVVRQIDFMTRRHRNMLEFAQVRALTGGFGLARSGEAYYFTALNASGNEWNIDMQYPANHTGNLGGILGQDWDDASTDIVSQMMSLRAQAIIESGYEPKHCWISSKALGYLMNNVSLQNIAGSANRVWNRVTNQPSQVEPANRDLGGLEVVFNAIPWITFHINDTVMSLGTSADPQGSDGFSASDVTRLFPENVAIFTPDPDNEWHTVYESAEPVRETVVSSVEFARGFKTWTRPFPGTPPGREAFMLDNFLPVIRVPRAVWVPTIWS